MDVLTLNGMNTPKCFNNGKTTEVFREEKLIQDIKNILSTLRGSLYGAPEWGSYLQEILFDPASSDNAALVKQEVIRCVEESYPMLKLEAVEVDLGDLYIKCRIFYKLYNSDLSIKLEFDINRRLKEDVTLQSQRL